MVTDSLDISYVQVFDPLINYTSTDSDEPAYSDLLIPNISTNLIDNDVILTPIDPSQESNDASPLAVNPISIEGVVMGDLQESENLINSIVPTDSLAPPNEKDENNVGAFTDTQTADLNLVNIIDGTSDSESLIGTDGDDIIHGKEGDDVIYGKGGNDQINGDAGNNDRMFAGEGDDTITDPDGVLGAHGESGNDKIEVTFAPDWDNNANPDDAPRSDGKITGGYGNDTITVTMNDPRFFINLKGDEPVNPISDQPQDGNDVITLNGFYANAVVDLGGGDDRFNGGVGADNVSGSAGNDTLIGGDGDDQLAGDRGDDVLTGGEGRDRFVLAAGAGTDLITDFTGGIDSIRLLGNLSFEQLTITQGTDVNVNNTLIALTSSNELLAILSGVTASDISAANFMV